MYQAGEVFSNLREMDSVSQAVGRESSYPFLGTTLRITAVKYNRNGSVSGGMLPLRAIYRGETQRRRVLWGRYLPAAHSTVCSECPWACGPTGEMKSH